MLRKEVEHMAHMVMAVSVPMLPTLVAVMSGALSQLRQRGDENKRMGGNHGSDVGERERMDDSGHAGAAKGIGNVKLDSGGGWVAMFMSLRGHG
eukprot:2215550-Amphidinium_carterae.1